MGFVVNILCWTVRDVDLQTKVLVPHWLHWSFQLMSEQSISGSEDLLNACARLFGSSASTAVPGARTGSICLKLVSFMLCVNFSSLLAALPNTQKIAYFESEMNRLQGNEASSQSSTTLAADQRIRCTKRHCLLWSGPPPVL